LHPVEAGLEPGQLPYWTKVWHLGENGVNLSLKGLN
jgi:hypothetical protein